MKLYTLIVFSIFINQLALSQTDNIEKKQPLGINNYIDAISGLNKNLKYHNFEFKMDNFLASKNYFFVDSSKINYPTFNVDLNLDSSFINLKKDYSGYFIDHCGALKNGVSADFKTSDVFVSDIIDNFVNNYVVRKLIFKN